VHAYLLKNHGVICAANTMAEAISNVARIETAAAEFLRQKIESSANLTPAILALTLSALTPAQI